jgi:hypothetical protein
VQVPLDNLRFVEQQQVCPCHREGEIEDVVVGVALVVVGLEDHDALENLHHPCPFQVNLGEVVSVI